MATMARAVGVAVMPATMAKALLTVAAITRRLLR